MKNLKDLKSSDVVVIGAGPAGIAAAMILHRAGHGVLVFERETFPRFVIGESLLPRCNDLLKEAGLFSAVEEQKYLVKRGALFLRDNERCSFDFDNQFTQGSTYTWQVPRDHFDQVLAQKAIQEGIPVFFNHKVVDAQVGENPQISVRDSQGENHQISCRFIIDASGYGRVLPRLLSLDLPSNLPHRKSVFTQVTGDLRPQDPVEEGRIWIVMDQDQAWFWIIPFSNGRTSVGVVAEKEYFKKFNSDPTRGLKEILAQNPLTAERLKKADFVFEPRVIDGYSISIKQLYGEGYCLVGNTTEFLDPVFSSGVTLALESACRAANLVKGQLAEEKVDWQKDYSEYMLAGIDAFRTYVNAWYDGSLSKIFFAPHPDPKIKQMICSVLAGYVWDQKNPFAKEHKRKVKQVLRLISPEHR